ncbi:MAG: hypothetical protein JSW27_14635 [Phycisphaerales bacterium]|nr:MAG: hypothetical protein JSW27_14635 [Phycisphaerales bacterium]
MGDVNLIPGQRLARKHRQHRLRTWMGICGAYPLFLAGGLLLTHFLWHGEGSSVGRENRTVEQAIHQHNVRVEHLRAALAEVTRELEVSRAIGAQPDWSKLLVLLGHELGEEVVLSQCGLATTDAKAADITGNLKAWLSSSPLEDLLATRRYRVKLAGFGRTQSSVSQFVLGLEQMGIFDSVRLITSYRQAFLDGQAIAFSIECWI